LSLTVLSTAVVDTKISYTFPSPLVKVSPLCKKPHPAWEPVLTMNQSWSDMLNMNPINLWLVKEKNDKISKNCHFAFCTHIFWNWLNCSELINLSKYVPMKKHARVRVIHVETGKKEQKLIPIDKSIQVSVRAAMSGSHWYMYMYITLYLALCLQCTYLLYSTDV
jgi:hypothetical protein